MKDLCSSREVSGVQWNEGNIEGRVGKLIIFSGTDFRYEGLLLSLGGQNVTSSKFVLEYRRFAFKIRTKGGNKYFYTQ